MNPRRLERIARWKASIDDAIAREAKRPLPDPLRLQGLKRARLMAKDLLAGIRSSAGGRGPRTGLPA